MHTPDYFNKYGSEYLPGHLGIVVTHVSSSEIRSELPVRKPLIAPNGYLHAGTVVTLADTCAGTVVLTTCQKTQQALPLANSSQIIWARPEKAP